MEVIETSTKHKNRLKPKLQQLHNTPERASATLDSLKLIERKFTNSFILDVIQATAQSDSSAQLRWNPRHKTNQIVSINNWRKKSFGEGEKSFSFAQEKRNKNTDEWKIWKMLFKSLMLSSLLALVAAQKIRKFNQSNLSGMKLCEIYGTQIGRAQLSFGFNELQWANYDRTYEWISTSLRGFGRWLIARNDWVDRL